MSVPPGGALNSPVGKQRKWSAFRTPDRVVPAKKKSNCTTFTLEKAFDPVKQVYTDNVRLGVCLKAGIKNPKGFIEQAWAAPALGEAPWSVRFTCASPRVHPHPTCTFTSPHPSRAMMCLSCLCRYYDSVNYVVVKTASQVDILLAAIKERRDEHGRDAQPFEMSEEFQSVYNQLATKVKPLIHIKQDEDDVTITGKTFSLSAFLDEIGFEPTGGAFHPKDLLAEFDELIGDVKEMAATYGWSVVHERGGESSSA